ncbi:MAG TPA: sigma-70 family RNA polymerase sigma factor [Solirubrobacteraceae bacterium]|nr:sigma-70 family RNA polymerase sigma factor [Solirubrobacteraceae bacterium]
MSTHSDSPVDHASGAARATHRGSLKGGAFEALFRDCAADVHGYAVSLLGDRQSAEDVTALAFERLYRFRARLDSARGTPRAWLFAIARNAALDELRRRRRHPSSVATEVPDPEDERSSHALERAERRATVRAALASLSRREQEVVLLKFHGQLSNGELARVLGISESNAGTRVHRALTHLRESCAELDRQEVA